jgi:hypothetical protein
MGAAPLVVWYEEMCAAPESTVQTICRFLGFREPTHIDLGRLQPQRDATNEQWRAALAQVNSSAGQYVT